MSYNEKTPYEEHLEDAKARYSDMLDKKYDLKKWMIFQSSNYDERVKYAERDLERFIEAFEQGEDWARNY